MVIWGMGVVRLIGGLLGDEMVAGLAGLPTGAWAWKARECWGLGCLRWVGGFVAGYAGWGGWVW